MKQILKLSITAGMREQYKELLRRDWNSQSLREVLDLVRSQFETGGHEFHFEWESDKTGAIAKKSQYQIPSGISEHLRRFLEQMNADLVPKVPSELPEQKERLSRMAYQASVYLTIQTEVLVRGDENIFRDTQSLLFLISIHVLMPQLLSKGLKRDHDFLLNAMYAHVKVVWTDNPAHHNYLLSVFFDYLGNRPLSLNLLAYSIRNTSFDDHDFLTKAQSYCSRLIDEGKVREAKTFLLGLIKRAKESDLDEIRQILDETYRYEQIYCPHLRKHA